MKGITGMFQKNTFENVYVMHTKVKEIVDVHYQHYVELNSTINHDSLRRTLNFGYLQTEFIKMREEIVKIQRFLKDSFDDRLETHRNLYDIFTSTVEIFLLLLDTDIKMFGKLKAKATATGKYGCFEYRRDSKVRNEQSTQVLSQIMALIDENNNTVHIDRIPNDFLQLVDYAIYLTTDIKEKYCDVPVKDIDYKALREELLAFYKEVFDFQCQSDFEDIKRDILNHTRDFGLLVRDIIDGVAINDEREKVIIDNLDELRENAYEVLCV